MNSSPRHFVGATPSLVALPNFARFMPDCGRKLVLPTTKNVGGYHDKSNQFTQPPSQCGIERARSPHAVARRNPDCCNCDQLLRRPPPPFLPQRRPPALPHP